MVKLADIGFRVLRLDEPLLKFQYGTSIYQEDVFKKKPYAGTKASIGVYIVKPMQNISEVKKCAFEVFVKNYYRGEGTEFPFSAWNGTKYTLSKRLSSDFNFVLENINGAETFPETTIDEMGNKVENQSVDLLVFICDSKTIGSVHDRYKVIAHSNKKRVQFLSSEILTAKVNSALSQERKDFIQGLSIQILAKCGGIPWKLDKDDQRYKLKPGSIVIGLGYKKPESGVTVRGAAHFFDQENSEEKFVAKSFSLSERDMRSLFFPTEVLKEIIKEAAAWYNVQSERQVTELYILKKSRINPRELDALMSTGLNWIHIFVKKGGTLLRLYDIANDISGKEFMIERGLALLSVPYSESVGGKNLNRIDATITTTGLYMKQYNDGNDYAKGTLGTPRPLELEIHSNYICDAENIAKLVLALTKVDWESIDLEYREPTVIKYAERMAELSYSASNLSPPVFLDNVNYDVRDLM